MAPAIYSERALAFLKNIKAEPENEHSRLMLANWLVANGDRETDTARGRFIRQQCQSRQAWPGTFFCDFLEPKHSEPIPRSCEFAIEWLAGLPGRGFVKRSLRKLFQIPPLHGCRFYRGLVGLRFEGTRWSRGASLMHPAWAWVDELVICSPSARGMRLLAGMPFLGNINRLSIGPRGMGSEIRGGDAIANILADSRYLSRLRTLDVIDCSMGPDGAAAIAGSPHLSRLEELMFGGSDSTPCNHIGDRGLSALSVSPYMANLTSLQLMWNCITSDGVIALAESPHVRGLKRLELEDNFIGDRGAFALAASPNFDRLDRLTFGSFYSTSRDEHLGPEGIEALRQRFGSRLLLKLPNHGSLRQS
jgi:uncharacterized protein (TIGR02996 family)